MFILSMVLPRYAYIMFFFFFNFFMTATVWLVCHVRGHASALITRLAYTTDTCRSLIVARGGCLQGHLARFSNNVQACTLKKKRNR